MGLFHARCAVSGALGGCKFVPVDESLLESRMRRVAKTYGLPNRTAYFLSQGKDTTTQDLVPRSSTIGKPILVFTTAGTNYTVLGSTGLGGLVAGTWCEVPYVDIVSLNGWVDRPDGTKRHKRDLHKLEVKNSNTTIQFDASPGGDFFALWNICLRVMKMGRQPPNNPLDRLQRW